MLLTALTPRPALTSPGRSRWRPESHASSCFSIPCVEQSGRGQKPDRPIALPKQCQIYFSSINWLSEVSSIIDNWTIGKQLVILVSQRFTCCFGRARDGGSLLISKKFFLGVFEYA